MPRRIVIALLLLGLCLSSGIPAALSATYELNIPNSVETPTREITIQGDTQYVSAVAKTAPGSELPIAVTAPENATYRVNLYNSDRQIVDQQPDTGDSTITFDLSDNPPGSYMALLYKDGSYKDAFPVVVQGYTMSIDAPSHTTPDSEITVTVTAKKTATVEDPAAVTVVLANDEQTVEATATNEGSQEYRASISLSEFKPGQASIYAVVQGSDDAFRDGRKEILGISDSSTLTIAQPTTETTDSSDPSTTTKQAPSETSTTATVTTVPTTTTRSTTNLTTMKTTSQTTTTSVTSDSQPSSTITSTSTTSTTGSSVITPDQSTTTTPEEPTQGIPGFGLVGSLIALCCFLLFLRR